MAERGRSGQGAARLRRAGILLVWAGIAGILLSVGPLFVWLLRSGQVPVDATPLDRTYHWSAGERTLYRDASLATIPFAAVSVTGPRGPVTVVPNTGSGTLTTGGSTYTAVAHLTVPVDGDYRVRIDAPGARITLQPAAPFTAVGILGFVVCVLATIGGTLIVLFRPSPRREGGPRFGFTRRWRSRAQDLARDVQGRPHDAHGTPHQVHDHPAGQEPARPYGPGRSDPQG